MVRQGREKETYPCFIQINLIARQRHTTMARKVYLADYHVLFVFTRMATGTTMSEPLLFKASSEDEYQTSVITYMMERLRSLGDGWKSDFFPLEVWEYKAYLSGL